MSDRLLGLSFEGSLDELGKFQAALPQKSPLKVTVAHQFGFAAGCEARLCLAGDVTDNFGLRP